MSVLLAAAILVVLVLVVGVADLARALTVRSTARTAADAGALAAAQELAFPTGQDPVEVARAFVAANGAILTSCACAVGSTDAVVEVQIALDGLFLVPGSVVVVIRSRAVVDVPSM